MPRAQSKNRSTPHIILTGYIYRDPEGQFVSHCVELDIDTWAPTLEEVRELTPRMLTGYFEAAEQMGTLDQLLEDLAARQSTATGAGVAVRWSATPTEKPTEFQTCFQQAA